MNNGFDGNLEFRSFVMQRPSRIEEALWTYHKFVEVANIDSSQFPWFSEAKTTETFQQQSVLVVDQPSPSSPEVHRISARMQEDNGAPAHGQSDEIGASVFFLVSSSIF